MATFIMLCSLTEQGIRNVKDTPKRAEAFRGMAKKAGATVKDFYWTLGKFDVVTIVEAPDDETMTSLALSVGVLGNIRTQVLRAFTADEIGPIISGMAKKK